MFLKINYILLLLSIFCGSVSAKNANSPTNISVDVDYYVDEKHEVDISSIELTKFHNHTDDVLNFGNNKATIWCRFKLEDFRQNQVLHLKTALIENAELYIPVGKIDFDTKEAGYKKSFSSLEYQIPNIYFNIPDNFNPNRYFYLKIDATYLQFWTYVGTSSNYLEYIYRTSIADGIYYGIIIIMMLYNLIIYLTARDKNYLYYVLYVLATGLMVAHFQGHDAHLWGELKFIADRGPIWPAIGGFFSVLFAYNFLKIKSSFPIFNKVFYFLFALWGGSIISVLLGFNLVSSLMNQTSGLLCIITFTYTSIQLMSKGMKSAKLFLLAWGFYMTASVYFVLCGANIFEYTLLTDYAWQIGSTLEMLTLSFAVGQKINDLKKDKENLLLDQNKILEFKVNERTEELKSSNEELNTMIEQVYEQHSIIKKKNSDLNASISYAKRIQNSMLPTADDINKHVKDHFVIYNPKDVVSGDIYWFTHFKGMNFIAAIDCTGHGVPGAFVSMMAVNIIREVITLKYLSDPADILEAMNKEVETILNQESSKSREGMDMSICMWADGGVKLHYAGAKNPLYIARDNGIIDVIPGNKRAIGGEFGIRKKGDPFITHEVEITDDIKSFYIMSDGIQDQFGGPNDKKFTRKRLQNVIKMSAHHRLTNQKTILEKELKNWQGEQHQIDDQLLIGFLP
ncbi:SpoIIE family protein phosphatase [Flammeovirga yaeyamensis]|uniref:SpoIIE family protein phosphatase n=1 Tax=Flammeovirga yaeyamensis TaxID=367791 RepID=A0AAX1NB72_9BACT|nr:7TM diverse intracellular signaling domain-containing protein [Flammeovirga yaeyamensis]MBB3697274.1 serine phosphatase RsbU (regulator of sigma subunit) [Flammeovirga yaeyamensis]NMF33931.1 SpoIIE family protein phosphatase [Flammeovirga yaeyamensis]QWG04809.1 SpoIIE family protein phosphatase [Flammeovirga yaeyamensis]